MNYDFKLEEVLFHQYGEYEKLKFRLETALLNPNNKIRKLAIEELYDIFGFSLKRCYIENKQILVDIGKSGDETTFYVCNLPETYLGKISNPKPFDFGRHIYSIEKLLEK